jgi:uncharacterized protein YndB with AHSA1/START domain
MTETALEIRRVIAASQERLFAAWTTPDLLVRWWGPTGVHCTAAEVDLRVGGAYRIANRMPDGSTTWITGEFEQVDPPRALVYSWRIGDEPVSRVRIELVALAARSTEVIVRHERIASTAARDGHERGWHGCLDGLAAWAAI